MTFFKFSGFSLSLKNHMKRKYDIQLKFERNPSKYCRIIDRKLAMFKKQVTDHHRKEMNTLVPFYPTSNHGWGLKVRQAWRVGSSIYHFLLVIVVSNCTIVPRFSFYIYHLHNLLTYLTLQIYYTLSIAWVYFNSVPIDNLQVLDTSSDRQLAKYHTYTKYIYE